MLDEVSTVARQHVDDGNLNHGVAGRLQAHRGTSNVDQYLTCEGRIVDLHVELQALVLGLSADTLAHEVHTVAHIANVVDAFYLEYVGLVRGEVGVGLDVLSHLLQRVAVFQLYIDHAAMDAFAQGDGHREGVLDTSLRAYADAVAHRHARSEVGIAQALGGEALHQGAHDRVGAWVPSGSNDADGIGLLVDLHEALTIAANVGVDVERVDGIDTQGQDLLGVFFARAGGSGQNGNVHILQFFDILNNLILSQFGWLVLCSVSAYYTSNLEVGSCFESLNGVLTDVAVTYDGCTNFLHFLMFFVVVLLISVANVHLFLEIRNKKAEKIVYYLQIAIK